MLISIFDDAPSAVALVRAVATAIGTVAIDARGLDPAQVEAALEKLDDAVVCLQTDVIRDRSVRRRLDLAVQLSPLMEPCPELAESAPVWTVASRPVLGDRVLPISRPSRPDIDGWPTQATFALAACLLVAAHDPAVRRLRLSRVVELIEKPETTREHLLRDRLVALAQAFEDAPSGVPLLPPRMRRDDLVRARRVPGRALPVAAKPALANRF
jgi:hypothetical protein